MIQDYLKAGCPTLLVITLKPERFIGTATKGANGWKTY
jgi:hypothetical protein